MDLKDLNPVERAALVALLQVTVLADGALSGDESAAFDLLFAVFGEQGYREAAELARERVQSLATLKALLQEVTDDEARELIYGTLLQVAATETVDARESQILELVGETWQLKPRFEGFPEESAE